MDPITIGLLAGSALGFLRGEEGKRNEKAERKYNAQVIRYSPWTGMRPDPVQRADATGTMMQGALSGAMLGQGIETANAQNALLEQQKAAMARSMSPYAAMNNPYLMNTQFSGPGTMIG